MQGSRDCVWGFTVYKGVGPGCVGSEGVWYVGFQGV